MSVLLYREIDRLPLTGLLGRYGLEIKAVDAGDDIPGSFWKDAEAGLIANSLYVRNDTPVHSALHESCHYICMDDDRRRKLHTDAGGTAIEEDSVCYLQILLARQLPFMGQTRMFSDMDEWGYSFRLGSAQAWFEQDAEDALDWLQQHGVVDTLGEPTYRLRQNP